jgi:hypothetical protein
MLFENTTVMMMVIIFTDLERTVTGQQEWLCDVKQTSLFLV